MKRNELWSEDRALQNLFQAERYADGILELLEESGQKELPADWMDDFVFVVADNLSLVLHRLKYRSAPKPSQEARNGRYMAAARLKQIAGYALQIRSEIKTRLQTLEDWMRDKISVAANRLDDVKHAMEYGEKTPDSATRTNRPTRRNYANVIEVARLDENDQRTAVVRGTRISLSPRGENLALLVAPTAAGDPVRELFVRGKNRFGSVDIYGPTGVAIKIRGANRNDAITSGIMFTAISTDSGYVQLSNEAGKLVVGVLPNGKMYDTNGVEVEDVVMTPGRWTPKSEAFPSARNKRRNAIWTREGRLRSAASLRADARDLLNAGDVDKAEELMARANRITEEANDLFGFGEDKSPEINKQIRLNDGDTDDSGARPSIEDLMRQSYRQHEARGGTRVRERELHANGRHFRYTCSNCGDVFQCRCTGPRTDVAVDECPNCTGKTLPGPLMENPARAYHHVVVKPLKDYKIVSTQTLQSQSGRRGPRRVLARLGRPKNGKGGSRHVEYLFPVGDWTIKQSIDWVTRHGHKALKSYEATGR